MNKEGDPTRAKVFKRHIQIQYIQELGWGNVVAGVQNTVNIGVELDGQEVWSKIEFPYFASLRQALGVNIPKPFFAQRIERTTRRAEKIASKLNKPTK